MLPVSAGQVSKGTIANGCIEDAVLINRQVAEAVLRYYYYFESAW